MPKPETVVKIWVASIVALCIVYGVIIYIAAHFIVKFW